MTVQGMGMQQHSQSPQSTHGIPAPLMGGFCALVVESELELELDVGVRDVRTMFVFRVYILRLCGGGGCGVLEGSS